MTSYLVGSAIALLSFTGGQQRPEDYEQILPRGRIAAIGNPEYVSANEARIAASSWVLGVIIDGQARAYSLNLLNAHEVVNDSIGETNFAAVWWPLANAAVVYSRDYEGETVEFEPSGGLINGSLVMQDRQTDTYWSIMQGKAIAGELEGNDLLELPVSKKMQWREWKARHPDTLVLSVAGKEDAPSAYRDYFAAPEGYRGQTAKDDRLPTKEPIFAFHHGELAYAVRQKDIEGGAVYELEDGGFALLLRPEGSSMFASTTAYLSERGFQQSGGEWVEIGSGVPLSETEPLRGFDTFWYNFSLNNPDARLLR